MPISIPYSFYHDCSVIQLEVKNGGSARISFIVKNSFDYPQVFVNPKESAIALFNIMKNEVGILMGTALTL